MRPFLAFPFYVFSLLFLFIAAFVTTLTVAFSSGAVLMSYWAEKINPTPDNEDTGMD